MVPILLSVPRRTVPMLLCSSSGLVLGHPERSSLNFTQFVDTSSQVLGDKKAVVFGQFHLLTHMIKSLS